MWQAVAGAGTQVLIAQVHHESVAAQVLAGDLGIVTENTAKWWTTHQHTGATFRSGQLVIIDEASLAGTLSLDRITQAAQEAGPRSSWN
ncbi:AAA family ATPase [Cutibacterium sp. V947]|uniref:AAA family ATPase n=1 Tax=unclassified Cutibacterium TaxID=2649671 RepID=UPI003EDF8BB8